MEFRIAKTFQDSLVRLSAEEQKLAKTAVFDLQMDARSPSLQFHRIEKVKDPNFWSARASSDIRVIVHKVGSSILVCYTGHHDESYAWAERRRVETHPNTGAAQIVEIRELVKEVEVRVEKEVEVAATAKRSLAAFPPEFFHNYGVPHDWVESLRSATDEEALTMVDHLPDEAGEAILCLLAGEKPPAPTALLPDIAPFDHPDAARRFRVIEDKDALELAFEYPREKWAVFLHPAQRDLIARNFQGPARVTGSAGTGKTVVALHRIAHLFHAEPDAKILLTTFSGTLARSLAKKLDTLLGPRETWRQRVEVVELRALCRRLYIEAFEELNLVRNADWQLWLDEEAKKVGPEQPKSFLRREWRRVVDAWNLDSWEAYRDVKRLGRGTRLGPRQREALWPIFAALRARIAEEGKETWSSAFAKVSQIIESSQSKPFDLAVVDEAQDISVAQLRFLAAVGAGRPNSLFFAGDLGQRIFQAPFSWKSLGVEVTGRSYTLRVNYRTSHQIRQMADILLPRKVSDVDGFEESRNGTVSVFNGPKPNIQFAKNEHEETRLVAVWLKQVLGVVGDPNAIGVFVRDESYLERAKRAVEMAGCAPTILDKRMEPVPGEIPCCTMHLAKGLEFRAVVVMACDDEAIPLQSRVEDVVEESELEDVYITERHLLYVACTRARDHLFVTGISPGSEFVEDMAE